MVTCASLLRAPGANVTLAEPSAVVTVPPAAAATTVGGARASVDDDEPVGGLAVALVSAVVSVVVVAGVGSDAVTVLSLEPEAVPDVDTTSTLCVTSSVALAPAVVAV